jgi:dienelactone hydrolase
MYKLYLSLFLISVFITFSASAKVLSQQLPYIFYVSIPVELEDKTIQVSAQYRIPRVQGDDLLPAVIIAHTSGGVDSTGGFYAKALNKAGIATLELDLWGARDLLGGTGNRPAVPQETLPDIFAALKYLADREEIDANKIGILGFSWGGVLSILTATERFMEMSGSPYRFAGHVAHYPVCWVYNVLPGFEVNNLTGAPLLIQAAELDDYDIPSSCPSMVESLPEADQENVELKVYGSAYHAWDRLEPELVVFDPFSHLGATGYVTLSPNKRIAKKSRRKVLNFFNKIFE